MKKKILFYGFILLGIILFDVQLSENCQAATKSELIELVNKILRDPMLPYETHGVKISQKLKHIPSKDEPWEKYKLVTKQNSYVGTLSISERSPDAYDFGLYLYNNGNSTGIVTDWDKMEPSWDAFVSRYWPSLHRISDWKNEIWRRSGSGTFTIQYVQTKQELEIFKVVLSIRLSDGEISSISTIDKRGLIKPKEISSPPSNEQIFTAVRKALKEKEKDFSEAKIIKSEIRRSIFPVPDGRKFIVDRGNLWMANGEGKIYIVNFDYEEKSQVAGITYISTQKKLDDFRQKPLTQVDDNSPSWSADGKQLYFVTSRRASGQPWWMPVAFQYAMAVNQVGTDNLQYISPVKTKHGDYGLYQSPQISPDGHYLAAGLGNDEAYLFLLNLTKGLLHIPQRDPAFLVRQQEKFELSDAFLRMTQSMFRDDGNKYPWISKGFQWLANGDFLYLG